MVDDRWVAEELLPQAIRVLPALEDAGLASSWVGLYEMTPDRHAILGPVAGLDGLYLAGGFSGHGFQHAPIVGTVIAELSPAPRPRSMSPRSAWSASPAASSSASPMSSERRVDRSAAPYSAREPARRPPARPSATRTESDSMGADRGPGRPLLGRPDPALASTTSRSAATRCPSRSSAPSGSSSAPPPR